MAKRKSLFERTNNFLDGHLTAIFWLSFVLTLTFGILLFDIRFSLSGDDSAYVIRASDFIHHFSFPGFQGPLYPIVLSPLIAVFGINPIPLKSLSILFMLGFVYFIYRAFKNRIPSLLLTALLVLVSVNSFILYYASQTYSEAFFMFLEALVFLIFFTYFIDDRGKQYFGVQVRHHLILALCILCLGITRSIGFSCVLAVSAYFILQRQWKNLVCFIIAFIIVMALFQGFKWLLWGNQGFQFNEQGGRLMYKDYYNPTSGKEDISGYVGRLILNSLFFLSSSLYTLLGILKVKGTPELYPSLTVLTYLVLVGSVVLAFKKNKYLFFTGIYVLIFLVNTFLILQTAWGQSRLIIPYVPLIMLMLFAFFYRLFSFKRLRVFSGILFVLMLILFGVTLNATIVNVLQAQQIKDRYWGLTPDWENYCKASEWASKNLSKGAIIACRKPTISFIYGNGRRFYGITEVKTFPGNSLLQKWQEKGSHLYYVSSSSLKQIFPPELYKILINSIVALGRKVDVRTQTEHPVFCILNFTDSVRNRISGDLEKMNIKPTHNIDSLKVYLNNPKETIDIIYPDTLLNILIQAKVTYVLEANLRRSATKKQGVLVNTVERFMMYMGVKYPQIATRVIQIGADDNEPAQILKLNYERYGLKIRE
jgi:hypothetical protein